VYILGISCFYHDAAAALLQDGMLVAAAEEERFSRRKHDSGFPALAIKFCLERAGITPDDLDYVVFYEKPFTKFERLLTSLLSTWPRSYATFREGMIVWMTEKLWMKDVISRRAGISRDKILFVEHHLSHAASAFFCSPFEASAVLTIDGVGEWTTATLGSGTADWGDGARTNGIELFAEARYPHSLGLLYSAFTAFLGFEVNDGEYKVMGMAPYGRPKYVDEVRRLIELGDDGSFWLDMDYFSFHHSLERTYSRKFEQLFGEARDPRAEFFTERDQIGYEGDDASLERNRYYADLAASVQRVTEEAILNLARYLHRRTGQPNLCLAGGVAYNSVANGRLLRETPFEQLYVQPAAGDSGGAVGAALYAYHVLLGRPRRFVMEHAYWGSSYEADEIKSALDALGVGYEIAEREDALLDRVTAALAGGQVIGWSQGRFEWGPRALGNRSILADPRSAAMKEVVNTKIKFREPFRPFAPSVLADAASGFFDLPGSNGSRPDPLKFMLAVLPVLDAARERIPACSHMGTGRLQMVERAVNPRYYGLIERFGQASGVPVLLNTSFNLRGEPIVTTPENALNTFFKSGLDLLVLDDFLIRKP
jgi:carbamoyltransferase